MEKENTVKPQSSLEKYVKKHPDIAAAIAYQCGGINLEWMCTMQDFADAEEEKKWK